MVDVIKSLKDEILSKIQETAREKGVDRIDGQMVDMVKDLAEAEKSCWEAEYYRTVTEQMGGKSGYMPMGYDMQNGYQYRTTGGYRRGYGMSGYGDAVEGVRNILSTATPEERERIKQEMRSM